MAVKLHRCSNIWVKIGGHPCWRVQKALDEKGIEYEVVKHSPRRGKRDEYVQLTGQKLLPAIDTKRGSVGTVGTRLVDTPPGPTVISLDSFSSGLFFLRS